jgi:hypothetical protein
LLDNASPRALTTVALVTPRRPKVETAIALEDRAMTRAIVDIVCVRGSSTSLERQRQERHQAFCVAFSFIFYLFVRKKIVSIRIFLPLFRNLGFQ